MLHRCEQNKERKIETHADGWNLEIELDYGFAWVVIDYCPFCGEKLEKIMDKE